jgi:thiol-disulfide isomerase/thioredoxin
MKKILSALALCAATLTATAQQYSIEGTAPEGVLKVFIKNFESKSVDSTFVSQGKFSFKGDAEGKLFAQVYTDDRRDVYVVLDGNVNINFADATVTGSEDNNLMSQWKKRLETNEAEIKSIMQQYQAKKQAGESDEALKPLVERYNALSTETSKNVITLCETYPNLKFPALYLAFYASNLDRAEVVRIADMKPAYLDLSLVARLKGYINGWRSQKPGAMVQNFAMADTTGTVRQLTDFVGKGNYVLVDFWASWCGPCKAEFPNLIKLHKKLKNKGLTVLGINISDQLDAFKQTVKNYGIEYPQMVIPSYAKENGAKIYSVNSIPHIMLIAPDGTILKRGLRGEDMMKYVEEQVTKK